MALLQISEPGMSPLPHERQVAVGIDLGTTHSLVAWVSNGHASCLPDAQGEVILPSAVHYRSDGSAGVGRAALAEAATDPRNVIVSAKRWMGRRLADVRASRQSPYEWVDHSGMVAVRTVQGVKTPVQVAAEILHVLARRAREHAGQELAGAVITVPAYFDDAQRQATKDAAQLAGLPVLRLINEPTAAALAYGLDQGLEGLYLIYDLGGGTFDVSLLRLRAGVFEVVATGGDAALGGDDIDAALVRWVWQQAAPQGLDSDALDAIGPASKRRLQTLARQVKEQLSDQDSAPFALTLPADEVLAQPLVLDVAVGRADLDRVAAPLIERTLRALRQVLRDADIAPDAVQGTVMVGGSTRMPAVRAAVARAMGREPLVDLNPDEVVALGAARQAQALVGQGADGPLLLDVIPLSLGLETMGGLVERIIERNTTIPAARAQEFTTWQDGQTAMAIHAVQGERELVADCRSLARFELRGIPPLVAGAARVRVTFAVDADGLLSVSAQELTTGATAQIEVKPSYGLADDDITRMLQDGVSFAQSDIEARLLREAQVEADRLLLATASALASDGHLLDAAERATIDAAVLQVQASLKAARTDTIDIAMKALAEATESLAARRMNEGIARALKGRSLSDIA
ncbi:Fe-S protein assembly chaperone HscA [Amphibiibacter pelophylacis]|uniref:Fe-S protein assembly chaperone HscA n=1 Tax=Amphibiibacter pelophylacis TaxID=1799477 RepID=A0ACC6P2C5_9BURK